MYKIKIIALFFSVCLFVSEVFAQSPVHPLVNYGPTRVDTNIDIMYYIRHYEMGGEVIFARIGTTRYSRSKDNLTDTVFVSAGLMRHDVYRYNEKNQLLYQYEFYPGHPLQSYVRKITNMMKKDVLLS